MRDKRFVNKVLHLPLSDDRILMALRDRDESTISYIYQTYWPMILQMVKTNNGSAAEAKDLYQDSIMDFLEKVWLENFSLSCKIRTFIYSICRNKWLYQLRGRKKFMDMEAYIEFEKPADDTPEEMPGLPDDTQITQAINTLGEPCRSLLVGYYYENMTMEQLANKLNYKSENVAKQQKFRCKDRLKKSLSAAV
jgi:RNA polymerase sigma factor (sigma-70 family)